MLSGRTDVPLSARGREELDRLARRLRGAPPFEAVYSSPLRRARETAAVLGEAGLGPVHRCSALEEIDCGLLDGMPIDQVRAEYPALWATNERQADDRFRWPGGESYREFRCRCLAAVRKLARNHPRGRVAVVTHAGVIGQLLGFLEGTSPGQWARYRPGTASLTELEWERGRGAVVRFDDRTHLAASPGPAGLSSSARPPGGAP